MRAMRRGFTLVEVNLAIFIMAAGVLAMVSLYSLGMRESRQSTEDVAAAGYADAVFAPLVSKLSSRNLTWKGWTSIGATPSGEGSQVCDGVTQNGKGWAAYVEKVGSNSSGLFRITVGEGWNSLVQNAFDAIANAEEDTNGGNASTGGMGANSGGGANDSALSISKPDLPSDFFYGLVATRKGSVISLAFRSSRRRDALMSQPVYYTEVHFQGRDDK